MLVLRADTVMSLSQVVATIRVFLVFLVRNVSTLSPVVLALLVSKGTGKTAKVGWKDRYNIQAVNQYFFRLLVIWFITMDLGSMSDHLS